MVDQGRRGPRRWIPHGCSMVRGGTISPTVCAKARSGVSPSTPTSSHYNLPRQNIQAASSPRFGLCTAAIAALIATWIVAPTALRLRPRRGSGDAAPTLPALKDWPWFRGRCPCGSGGLAAIVTLHLDHRCTDRDGTSLPQPCVYGLAVAPGTSRTLPALKDWPWCRGAVPVGAASSPRFGLCTAAIAALIATWIVAPTALRLWPRRGSGDVAHTPCAEGLAMVPGRCPCGSGGLAAIVTLHLDHRCTDRDVDRRSHSPAFAVSPWLRGCRAHFLRSRTGRGAAALSLWERRPRRDSHSAPRPSQH
jgi:hypothetical protein